MGSQAVFELVPVPVGWLTVGRHTLYYQSTDTRPVSVPICIWVARNDRYTMVIDAGAPTPEFTSKWYVPMRQAASEEPVAALRNAGVDPREVDSVIVSHLHFDHVGNCGLFPNSRLLVQRDEWRYAQNPLPVHAKGFQHPSSGLPRPGWYDLPWELLDGDLELVPGIDLWLTPGHTPGLQAVRVQTATGPVCLASDTVPTFRNLAAPAPGERFSATHYRLDEYTASLDRLLACGAAILPSHDPEVFSATWNAPSPNTYGSN